jgi:uncharacterized caspase-like protein
MNRAMITTAALLTVAFALPTRSPAQAQGGGANEGRQFALLIGVEKYQKARPLVFTLNDVKTLSKTLRDRNGVREEGILAITDDDPNPTHRPTRAAMLEEIPRWLSRIGPKDRLIVYFSGHGFRDPAGRLYLAPIDVDPADPANTGLPVEWFRQQVADCKASFKLLVLDACHSGSEKGEEKNRDVPSKDIGDQFKGLERVVTLASSTGEESSQIWEDKEQSLYTYWLNQALKGNADADGNGAVDIDELNKYVYNNVVRTAKAHFGNRKQTPVRSVRTGVEGTPVVVRVAPIDLKTLLNDIAEQIALAAQDKELKKVGVLQFSGYGGMGELVGANYGTLGQFCSEWMEKRLMAEGGGFEITNGKVLQAALKRERFGLDDLSNPERMKQLSKAMNGLPSLAHGAFLSRVGQVITIQCRLVQIDGDELIGSAGGSALLSASEWAMLGRSAALSASDVEPPRPTFDAPPQRDPQEIAISKLDAKATAPHPLTNPNFEFPVKIMVGGKERKGIPKGNFWIVPLRTGETFEILVGNNSGKAACMRLLVDGLNTLPDLEMSPSKGVATMLWGQHVNLDDARYHILDPAALKPEVKKAWGNTWSIGGFATETGENGKLRQFLVGTAEQSLAAKRKFTEQLGLITVAFYEADRSGDEGRARGHQGIIPGDEKKVKISEVVGYKPGKLRVVLNIHYVDADDPKAADSLQAIQSPDAPPAPSAPQS